MTLRHMDGMALYDSAARARTVGKFDFASTSSSWAYRNSGAFGAGSYAVAVAAGAIANLAYDCTTKPWYTSTSTIVFGLRFKLTGSFVNSRGGVAFVKTDGTQGWSLACNGSGGGLAIWLNDSSGSPLSILGGTYTATVNVWDYHEFKFIPAATDGTHRLIWKVNGSQIYDSGATLTLGGTAFGRIQLGGAGSMNTVESAYSDFYICDGSGTRNNDFLGDTRVETLLPSAAGSHSDMSQPATNLLTSNQYGAEAGTTTGWAASQGAIANSTAQAYEGTHSFVLTGNPGPIVSTPTGTSGVAVSGSTVYTAALRLNGFINSGDYVHVDIVWYDSGGTLISTSTGTTVGTSFVAGWNVVSTTATAPSNAAFAAVKVDNSGIAGVNTYIDTICLAAAPSTFFAPPSASNYQLVNDGVSDGDVSYVVTSTVGGTDSYAMTDLISTSGTPIAVLATSVVRKETPTARTVSSLVRVSATDYVGTASVVNNDLAYHGMATVWETNPNTSATWTISNVNALEAGIQLAS